MRVSPESLPPQTVQTHTTRTCMIREKRRTEVPLMFCLRFFLSRNGVVRTPQAGRYPGCALLQVLARRCHCQWPVVSAVSGTRPLVSGRARLPRPDCASGTVPGWVTLCQAEWGRRRAAATNRASPLPRYQTRKPAAIKALSLRVRVA
jgi:hypothetical protein